VEPGLVEELNTKMGDVYTVGGFSNQSFDCDASGDFLYLAVKGSTGLPLILKMSTAINANPTESFNPGSGSFINLVCGDYDAGIIWACGNFGSYRVVRNDDLNGMYWYQADDEYWYGIARPIHLGPGNDNIAMVSLPASDELKETYWFAEDGPYWTSIGSNLPFDVRSFDRLDIDPFNIVIGVDESDPYWYPWGPTSSYWYEVEQSRNDGYQFVDISGILIELGVGVTTVLLI
jgi:hypothetical protein